MHRYGAKAALPFAVLALLALLVATLRLSGPLRPNTQPAASRAASIAITSDQPNGLVTNEYAYWNPGDATRIASPDWQMTSGSLFARDGAGWTGIPDDVGPDRTSSNGNDSAVFRLRTARDDLADVSVSFRLRVEGFVTTQRTPAVDWDGVDVFMRYQSEYELYYASVDRRDGTTAIKKKLPGGPTNGGTYYTLATGTHVVPIGRWEQIQTTVRTRGDGKVAISISVDGRTILSALDDGTQGGRVIAEPGAVGLRGDNCQFSFADFSTAAP